MAGVGRACPGWGGGDLEGTGAVRGHSLCGEKEVAWGELYVHPWKGTDRLARTRLEDEGKKAGKRNVSTHTCLWKRTPSEWVFVSHVNAHQ